MTQRQGEFQGSISERMARQAEFAPLWMMMGATLVGLALRLLLLGSKSFWLDETLSVELAANIQHLWTGGFDHSHPPLYYMLLHYWLPLAAPGTTGEFVLRLSSAIVGSLAIPLSYALAVALSGANADRRVAYTTVWLVALSPLLVWYAQELRSYSLLVVLGLVMAVALVRVSVQPQVGWWLLFVLAMSAALYTHYAAVLLVVVQVGLMAVLYLQQRLARHGVWLWLAAWPVVALVYWPWLTAPGMAAFVGQIFSSDFYVIDFLALRLGLSAAQVGMLLVVVAVVGLVVVGVLARVVLGRGMALWQGLAAMAWLRYGVLLLMLALIVFGVVPRLYTLKKLVVALWPFGLLVVAWLLPWQRANRVAIGVLLVASLAGALVNVTVVPKDQWRTLVAQLAAQSEDDDLIWVVPRYQGVPLSYYLVRSAEAEVSAANIGSVAASMNDADLAALIAEGQRVWLIYHTGDVNLRDPNRRLRRWLDANMVVRGELHLYRMDMWLYAPRP